MNVKDAVNLMVRNPAVDFPWEGTVINLINGFLPPGSQLDPLTAQAAEVQSAVDSLEASLRDMVYNSSIGIANVTSPLPAPVTAAKAANHSAIFKLFAIGCIVWAVLQTMKTGGLQSTDAVELIKFLVTALTGKPVDSP